MKKLQDALDFAVALHTNELVTQQNVEAKLSAATAARIEAVEARLRLVAGAAAGGEIDRDALSRAEAAITRATSEVALWTDARAGASAAVAAALIPVNAAQRAIGDYKFALAAKHRIDAADALDRIGQEFARVYWAYQDTAPAIRAACDEGHRLDATQESNLARKEMGIRVIPASIASLLAQGAFPFPEGQTLAQHERAAFGAWAARADQIAPKD
jgi:hypothetical protein